MKIRTRRSVFETNSSSVHAVAIDRTGRYEKPSRIVGLAADFADGTYSTPDERLSALWSQAVSWQPGRKDEWRRAIEEALEGTGVEPVLSENAANADFNALDSTGFLEALRNNASLLRDYILGKGSVSVLDPWLSEDNAAYESAREMADIYGDDKVVLLVEGKRISPRKR